MSAFNVFSKIWFLKNRTNFTVSLLFASGTAYFYIRYQNDKKLEHPVINEAIRILENHDQIVELIGYPIYTHATAKSKIAVTNSIINAAFLVRGPKGYLNLELAGQSKLHGFLQKKNVEVQKAITDGSQSNYSDDKIKKEKAELENYYILDNELKVYLENERISNPEKLNAILIPDTMKLWKIDYLYADIDQNFRLVILPTKNQPILESTDGRETSTNSIVYKKPINLYMASNPARRTLNDLLLEEAKRRKRDPNDTAKTEEELEELRKFRMQEMYRKMGYIRLYTVMVGCAAIMSGYILLTKYRRHDLSGGVLYNQVIRYVSKNDFVVKNVGKNIKFMEQIRGAAIDDEANFNIDALGDKNNAVFTVKAIYDKKIDEWKILNIDILIRDAKGKESLKKKIL